MFRSAVICPAIFLVIQACSDNSFEGEPESYGLFVINGEDPDGGQKADTPCYHAIDEKANADRIEGTDVDDATHADLERIIYTLEGYQNVPIEDSAHWQVMYSLLEMYRYLYSDMSNFINIRAMLSEATATFLNKYRNVEATKSSPSLYIKLVREVFREAMSTNPNIKIDSKAGEAFEEAFITMRKKMKAIYFACHNGDVTQESFRDEMLDAVRRTNIAAITVSGFLDPNEPKLGSVSQASIDAMVHVTELAERYLRVPFDEISETHVANLDGHSDALNDFTKGITLLMSLKGSEFEKMYIYEKNEIRSTWVIESTYEIITSRISKLRFDFDLISSIQSDIRALITQLTSNYESIAAEIADSNETSQFAIHQQVVAQPVSASMSMFSDGPIKPRPAAAAISRRFSYRFMTKYARYRLHILRLLGVAASDLDEYRTLALKDGIKLAQMKKAGIPIPQPAPPASATSPVPSPTELKSDIVPESVYVPTATEAEEAIESDEPLLDLAKEEARVREVEFYKRLRVMLRRPRPPEAKAAEGPDERSQKLSAAGRKAWLKMSPGKTVTTEQMMNFFSDLVTLNLVEGAEFVSSGLKVHFKDKLKKTFHRRHYALDHTTLDEIQRALKEANIDVESLL